LLPYEIGIFFEFVKKKKKNTLASSIPPEMHLLEKRRVKVGIKSDTPLPQILGIRSLCPGSLDLFWLTVRFCLML